MRRAVLAPVFLAAVLTSCSSQPSAPTAESVFVTHDRSKVRPCVDLAQVKTNEDGGQGEKDLRQQTADLGGNVLLVYNEHSGGAFYCERVPVDISISDSRATPPPRKP